MSPPSLLPPEGEQELEARAPPAAASSGADSCSEDARGDAIHHQCVAQPDSGEDDEEVTPEGEGSNEPATEVLPALQQLSAERSGVIGSSQSLQADRTSPNGPVQEGAGPDKAETSEDQATPSMDCPGLANSRPGVSGRQPSQRAVSSTEMFEALVEDMAESPNVGQVEAWRTTIKTLFAKAFNAVSVQTEDLPAARKRFPKLNAEEASSLVGLFEQVFVRNHGTFSDWQKMATAITHELLTTKWALKEIIRRLSSQHKWAQAPVLNQWARVVRTGATSTNQEQPCASIPTQRFEDFMFDPSAFTEEQITRFRSLCAAQGARAGQHQVREGTDDEWTIIAGLVEGTVACRRMPDFIQQVLKGEERLRLYSTIQAQVEGELILQLDRAGGIKLSRRTTKAITEAILESAELARINLPDLHLMLNQTKTIGYDHVTKTIHFYFFTRTTAARHKDVRVPFYGGVYRLQNAHRTEQGSIWQRQHGLNGKPRGRRVEYTVHLHNLSRFSDVGRIAAYFKAKIPTEFEMEDLDTHTPESRTSTIWRVTFKLAGCPTFLDGVVRLLWFGTTIIVKHPNVGHRLQCLQCGNLGHTIARCNFTDALLRGPGGLVVTEQDVLELEDLAKPFSSLEEIKVMAARRLLIQEEAETAAEAAVMPPPKRETAGVSPAPSPTASTNVSSAPLDEQGKKFEHIQPRPKPMEEQPWLTRLSKKGRSRPKAFRTIPSKPSSIVRDQHAVDEDETQQQAAGEPKSLRESTDIFTPVTDLTAAIEAVEQLGEQPPHSTITSEELQRKTSGLARGSVPVLPVPVIMTLKRNERKSFSHLAKGTNRQLTVALPIGARSVKPPETLAEMEHQLGLRSVVTPATGNCLAMAIAQAAVDATLDDPDRSLELLTACLKRGIKYTGLLNLEDQMAHDHRVHLLENVWRGWTGMTRTNSASQVRWYLEDYASSSSDRTDTVPEDTWGGSDTAGMASNFLKRPIYVFQLLEGDAHGWRCVKYVPTTVSRHHRVVETWAEYPQSVAECMDEVVAWKIDSPSSPPLVLNYHGRHYSAFLHSGITSRLPDFEMEEKMQATWAQDRQGHGYDTDEVMAEGIDVHSSPPKRASVSDSPPDCASTVLTLVTDTSRQEQSRALVTVERQLALPPQATTPPRQLRSAPPLDRKRGHESSPEKEEARADNTPHRSDKNIVKRGRAEPMPLLMITNDASCERIDRDDWAAAWELLEPAWPNPHKLPFPTANSSTSEWEKVARLAPDHLLWMVKRFVFPGELLRILDNSVVAQWMTESRRDCVEDALERYSTTPMDRQTQLWVERWLENARRRPDHTMLSPLMDNLDDWKKLEALNYAGDDLLKLCDPRRRSRLSQHLLCALLYDREIAALGDGLSLETNVADKIRSHFQLIATNAGYKAAYYSSSNLADWAALEGFFYDGLARPEENTPLHY